MNDLVILSVLHLSDEHVESLPIEVQRADAFYDFLQMPAIADESGSTLSAEFWGGHLDGVAGTLGFPVEQRVSLVLITMLIAATGVNRTLLQRLLGGGHSPSLFGEKYSPASTCPTLQPPHCFQADDVE